MKNISRGLLVLVILVLSSCAIFNQKAIVQDRTANKSIGVVSTFENSLHVNFKGITYFNDEKGTIPVPDWNINENIMKNAVEALQASKRYISVSAIFGITRKSEDFPKVVKDRKVDILVLIEPKRLDVWEGLGIDQHSLLSMHIYTHAYVLSKVEVFDVQSGKSIGSSFIGPMWLPLKTIRVQPGPTISDHALSQLEETMTKLTQTGVRDLLFDLGLITEAALFELPHPCVSYRAYLTTLQRPVLTRVKGCIS